MSCHQPLSDLLQTLRPATGVASVIPAPLPRTIHAHTWWPCLVSTQVNAIIRTVLAKHGLTLDHNLHLSAQPTRPAQLQKDLQKAIDPLIANVARLHMAEKILTEIADDLGFREQIDIALTSDNQIGNMLMLQYFERNRFHHTDTDHAKIAYNLDAGCYHLGTITHVPQADDPSQPLPVILGETVRWMSEKITRGDKHLSPRGRIQAMGGQIVEYDQVNFSILYNQIALQCRKQGDGYHLFFNGKRWTQRVYETRKQAICACIGLLHDRQMRPRYNQVLFPWEHE